MRQHQQERRGRSHAHADFSSVTEIATASLSVFVTRHPRSDSAISFRIRSSSLYFPDTRNAIDSKRSGTPPTVPITDTRTSDTSASRVLTAASSVLKKQPPRDISKYSPPRGPRSLPPFSTGRSTNTVCDRAVALPVDGPTCSISTLTVLGISALCSLLSALCSLLSAPPRSRLQPS